MSFFTPTPRKRRIFTRFGWMSLAAVVVARVARWEFMLPLVAAWVALSVVVSLLWWRCEHCYGMLGRGGGRGFCPRCGGRLG